MQIKDIFYFGLVGACLIGIIFIFFFMRAETTQCVKNPFVYGASQLGNVSCSCTQYDPICSPHFYFNDTSFDNPVTKCGDSEDKWKDFRPINLSFSKE